MPKEFNPLVDIATFMVSIAKALPPFPSFSGLFPWADSSGGR